MSENTSTVGKYLATRLEQMGLKHYFVVPGDYNLILLDELLTNKNMHQVGNCNELNAAYAAEGYARANGAGALVVTYNVGAFSALNGVASAYAENLPVIFISGSYNTNDPVADHYIHHTLGVHDLTYQREMIAKVTCESVWIHHAMDAPHLIDRAIRSALRTQKPAYIEIPCNLANQPCSEPVPFETLLSTEQSDAKALTLAVEAVHSMLRDADRPVLLAGSKLRAHGARQAFHALAEALGCPVAVMPDAKGFFPEEHPLFAGIYWGEVSSPGCAEIVNGADLILAAGPAYTDYTTVGWTAQPPKEKTINALPDYVRLPNAEYTYVELRDLLSTLALEVQKKEHAQVENKKPQQGSPEPPAQSSDGLTRVEMVAQIQHLLDSKTTLLVESGDAWFEGIEMYLPAGARFEIEMMWGAIGWSVPATLGYALGVETGRKIVAMIGDGSFRYTAQEVATMIEQKADNIIIFLLNNAGYIIEKAIHDGPYNYYKNWDYAALVAALNAEDGHGLGLKARTGTELAEAIQRGKEHTGGPVLIECIIGKDDYNPKMSKWGQNVSKANSRPPQV